MSPIFSSDNTRIQVFSLPKFIIDYISDKNNKVLLERSPQFFYKLYFTCKSFFPKLNIIPCPLMGMSATGIFILNKRILNYYDIYEKRVNMTQQNLLFYPYECITNDHPCDDENCSILFLSPKIWNNKASAIDISHQNITLEELKSFFSLRLKQLHLFQCSITGFDGTNVLLEEILSCCPRTLKDFILYCGTEYYTEKTASKICELQRFKNLIKMELFNLPRNFDISSFKRFIKKNYSHHNVQSFMLYFSDVDQQFLKAIDKEIAIFLNSRKWFYTKKIKPNVKVYRQQI